MHHQRKSGFELNKAQKKLIIVKIPDTFDIEQISNDLNMLKNGYQFLLVQSDIITDIKFEYPENISFEDRLKEANSLITGNENDFLIYDNKIYEHVIFQGLFERIKEASQVIK